MTNKQISQASDIIMRGDFPLHCVFRDQQDQDDVGIDYEIELLTEKDQGTAFIFKIQLKGTENAVYDKDGSFVFSKASVEKFIYYTQKLDIPLIFVVGDVVTKKCFWIRVQGNKTVESLLDDAIKKNQSEFTIKFPASKVLKKDDECGAAIVEAVEASSNSITLRRLRKISPASVREQILKGANAGDIEKHFRLFAGVAANEDIRQMIRAGDFDAAAKKAQELLESESESPEIRVLGGVSLAHALNVIERRKGSPSSALEAAKYKFGVAARMLQVCRSGHCEKKTRRYVRMYLRAARMHINGRRAMALAVSDHTQSLQGGTMVGAFIQIHWLEVSSKVARDFFKLREAMYRLGKDGFFDVMPYAWAEMAESVLPFVSSLRVSGRGDLANAFVDGLAELLPFCVQVVRGFKNDQDVVDELASIGVRFIGLADASIPGAMSDHLAKYEEILKGDPPFDCLDVVRDRLKTLVDGIEANSAVKAAPTMDELRSYFAQQAAELGINLEDADDPTAQIVRIGLEDLDPTRVSRTCEFLHVMVDSYGLPAQWLGLRTAGSKKIVCLKHGHEAGALRLDDAYETFAQRQPWDSGGHCCEDCPDRKPHPDGWSWSQEWDIAQSQKFKTMMKP